MNLIAGVVIVLFVWFNTSATSTVSFRVGEYSTVKGCDVIGKQWVEDQKKILQVSMNRSAFYRCVPVEYAQGRILK